MQSRSVPLSHAVLAANNPSGPFQTKRLYTSGVFCLVESSCLRGLVQLSDKEFAEP